MDDFALEIASIEREASREQVRKRLAKQNLDVSLPHAAEGMMSVQEAEQIRASVGGQTQTKPKE